MTTYTVEIRYQSNHQDRTIVAGEFTSKREAQRLCKRLSDAYWDARNDGHYIDMPAGESRPYFHLIQQ